MRKFTKRQLEKVTTLNLVDVTTPMKTPSEYGDESFPNIRVKTGFDIVVSYGGVDVNYFVPNDSIVLTYTNFGDVEIDDAYRKFEVSDGQRQFDYRLVRDEYELRSVAGAHVSSVMDELELLRGMRSFGFEISKS